MSLPVSRLSLQRLAKCGITRTSPPPKIFYAYTYNAFYTQAVIN